MAIIKNKKLHIVKGNKWMARGTSAWLWQDIAFLTTIKVSHSVDRSTSLHPLRHTHTVLYQPSQKGLIIVFHCLDSSKTDPSVKICDRKSLKIPPQSQSQHFSTSHHSDLRKYNAIYLSKSCAVSFLMWFLIAVSHHLKASAV